MHVNSFRRIGYIYAALCFLCSGVGAVYSFANIVAVKTVCVDYFCEAGFENLLISVISMIVCLMSATFSLIVKLGIEEVRKHDDSLDKVTRATSIISTNRVNQATFTSAGRSCWCEVWF